MKIKWERNSRVLSLVAKGKINDNDILPRSRTDEFPANTATVRMQRLSEKIPNVTVHIRGKSKPTKLWNGSTCDYAHTCRVNVANSWRGGESRMSSSGELDEDLSWLDVHNTVEEVKETLDI